MIRAVTEDEPFRFVVRDAFTLSGREAVLAGYIESGNVRPGDHLWLVHGTSRTPAVCQRVSPIREAEWRPGNPVLVGLSIPELLPEQVAADDLVTSLEYHRGVDRRSTVTRSPWRRSARARLRWLEGSSRPLRTSKPTSRGASPRPMTRALSGDRRAAGPASAGQASGERGCSRLGVHVRTARSSSLSGRQAARGQVGRSVRRLSRGGTGSSTPSRTTA